MTARIAAGHVDVWRTSVPWVCSTPFGSAVEPEVCTMIGQVGGGDLGLDGRQHVVRHHGSGVIVEPRRPAPVRIAGEHDAPQVRRAPQREPVGG